MKQLTTALQALAYLVVVLWEGLGGKGISRFHSYYALFCSFGWLAPLAAASLTATHYGCTSPARPRGGNPADCDSLPTVHRRRHASEKRRPTAGLSYRSSVSPSRRQYRRGKTRLKFCSWRRRSWSARQRASALGKSLANLDHHPSPNFTGGSRKEASLALMNPRARSRERLLRPSPSTSSPSSPVQAFHGQNNNLEPIMARRRSNRIPSVSVFWPVGNSPF